MTTLYAVEVYVIAAGVVGMLLLRRASDRAWVVHNSVTVTLSIDTSGFDAAFRRLGLRDCGCYEGAEHHRDCADHPLNRGWRTAWRYRWRAAAERWHRWRSWRLTRAATMHDAASFGGRWRR